MLQKPWRLFSRTVLGLALKNLLIVFKYGCVHGCTSFSGTSFASSVTVQTLFSKHFLWQIHTYNNYFRILPLKPQYSYRKDSPLGFNRILIGLRRYCPILYTYSVLSNVFPNASFTQHLHWCSWLLQNLDHLNCSKFAYLFAIAYRLVTYKIICKGFALFNILSFVFVNATPRFTKCLKSSPLVWNLSSLWLWRTYLSIQMCLEHFSYFLSVTHTNVLALLSTIPVRNYLREDIIDLPTWAFQYVKSSCTISYGKSLFTKTMIWVIISRYLKCYF